MVKTKIKIFRLQLVSQFLSNQNFYQTMRNKQKKSRENDKIFFLILQSIVLCKKI